MRWTLDWSAVAEQDLRELPMRLAMRLDAALIAFAEDRPGEGVVERMVPTDPRRLRYRLGGASALLWIDEEHGVVHVSRVLRNR